ncbi:hypothetical protein ABG768_010685, partial [Culter alburnus]
TAERIPESVVAEIVGVSEQGTDLLLLCADFSEFVIPATLYQGSVDDLIMKLPVHLKVTHVKTRVVEVDFVNN